MQRPGQRLREVRETLRLKYRDVEEASQWIANQHGNHAFLVGISRLADIENKGTIPSLFRLYSLCTIYRIEYTDALAWYGIDLSQQPVDAAHFGSQRTQPFDLEISDDLTVQYPEQMRSRLDFRKTDHLSRSIAAWGKLPVSLLGQLDVARNRYAFIGTDDWSMYPIIPPGSFVQLDEKKQRVQRDGWTTEYERPIYFVEHREGFRCGWCTLAGDQLIVLPHYSSNEPICMFNYPGEATVIGQVVGVVMRLDQAKRRHTHF